MPPASAREYLFSLEVLGIKLGLDQIRGLTAALDHPDHAFPSIVIAGTNGKGSVAAMVERGLRAAGWRTGRYISPHLVDIEERVAIDGQPIAPDRFEAAAGIIREAAAALPAAPSFFEATTALALHVFREERVDVAVLEVGLGGRLDATNVVTPAGVAITAIDFDHEAYLGHTIEAIAGEKAGVIKDDGLVVLGRNPPAVQSVVARAAAERRAAYVYAPDGISADVTIREGVTRLSLTTPMAAYGTVTLALRGRHQVDNAVTAVRLLEQLSAECKMTAGPDAIRMAMTEAEWPGRLEMRRWRGHEVLLDGAHNPAGARALAAYLRETYDRPLPLVFGAMRDKDVAGMIAVLAPVASSFTFTTAATARAARPADLAVIARTIAPALASNERDRPADAVADACARGSPAVVAGSLFLIGEVRAETS